MTKTLKYLLLVFTVMQTQSNFARASEGECYIFMTETYCSAFVPLTGISYYYNCAIDEAAAFQAVLKESRDERTQCDENGGLFSISPPITTGEPCRCPLKALR